MKLDPCRGGDGRTVDIIQLAIRSVNSTRCDSQGVWRAVQLYRLGRVGRMSFVTGMSIRARHSAGSPVAAIDSHAPTKYLT